MLLYGIFGGVQMMIFIIIVITFVIYVYALIGYSLFKLNDPWHFGDMARSMITLLRCGTLEDWSDIFYINYYGCDVYNAGVYHPPSNSTSSDLLAYTECAFPKRRKFLEQGGIAMPP